MTINPRPSLREAVNLKCRECIVDNLAPGKWREQVAACISSNCPLFEIRPVPRDCIRNGVMDSSKIAAVRTKLLGRDTQPKEPQPPSVQIAVSPESEAN